MDHAVQKNLSSMSLSGSFLAVQQLSKSLLPMSDKNWQLIWSETYEIHQIKNTDDPWRKNFCFNVFSTASDRLGQPRLYHPYSYNIICIIDFSLPIRIIASVFVSSNIYFKQM